MKTLQRFYPVTAFLAGFVWDALTIGRRVRILDLWSLGGYLLGAGLLVWWLAYREYSEKQPAEERAGLAGQISQLLWQAPYLLLQFFYGGIFSALFIFYFKSAGHLGSWLMAALLGALLIGNEFVGKRYGQRFTLVWALFALNAILLLNFVLPHAIGSLNPAWFYVSTSCGILLTHVFWRVSPGRFGRIAPAWVVAGVLMAAWRFDMIAPVPLVRQELAVGQQFEQARGEFAMQVEPAPFWQIWREQAVDIHVPEGGRLYGVSSVFAPLGVGAALEHRWERWDAGGWHLMYRRPFDSTGGRERGFRGYSWVLNPAPGRWRFTVSTQDGRTIGIFTMTVQRGQPVAEAMQRRVF